MITRNSCLPGLGDSETSGFPETDPIGTLGFSSEPLFFPGNKIGVSVEALGAVNFSLEQCVSQNSFSENLLLFPPHPDHTNGSHDLVIVL